jgi:hypothetical protein
MKKESLFVAPKGFLEKREQWRERPVITEEDLIGTIHTKIKPLGYQFRKIPGFQAWDFYRGEEKLAEELFDIEGFSIDKQKRNFVFLSKQREKDGEVLVFIKNDKVKKIKKGDILYDWYNYYRFYPFYIDNDLVWCEVETEGYAKWDGIIRNQNKILYSFTFVYGAGGMPVHFRKTENKWFLEIDNNKEEGRIILNGEELQMKYNYSGMWQYYLLKDKPFFFFTRKGDKKYRMSYNEKEVPGVWYDFVGYNGAWGVKGNDIMIWFFAEREGQWYYVEAGIYK